MKLPNILFVVFALFFASCQTLQSKDPAPSKLNVTESTIQLLGPLFAPTLEEPLKQLNAVPKGGTAYIYIYSAGGDPIETDAFLDAMEGKTTVCMGEVAGGPAFTVLQNCTYRLSPPGAIMGNTLYTLQGADGKTGEAAVEYVAKFQEASQRAIDIESSRLNIEEDEYRKLLSTDGGYAWSGDVLREKGAVDVYDAGLTCDKSTITSPMSRSFPFAIFMVDLKFAKCPIDRQYMGQLYPTQLFRWFGVPFVFPQRS